MEAVGQLTGGIAHDFNNLLTVVIGNIDMGRRALDAAGGDARTRRALDNAQKGAERAASLTQRLLAFSRRQPLAPKPLNVDRLVLGMSDMLARALGEMIEVEIVTAPGLWRVEADPNQLEAAILNLVVNARDAMPAGGQMTVETANVRLDESYSAAQVEVAPGHYVMIAVTDTGQGMPKEVLSRVFEPFFTTKDVGKGTGLGLSQVYGFVKQSGGHIKVYSEEGEGTTVKLYMPRLLAGDEPEEEPGGQAVEVGSHEETILVVEDDDDVRGFTVQILREAGYRVIEAHDGPSALRLLERQEQPVDLLFTDVVMPGMSGRELALEAERRQLAQRTLYTSGYTRDAIVHGGRLDPGVEMIAKPFTYQALSQKVRDMLDRGRTGRLLLVKDDPVARDRVAHDLTARGYAIDDSANAAEALNRIRAGGGGYDAILDDDALADRRADGVMNAIRALYRDLPIMILSAPADEEANRARFAGDRCIGVVTKPVDPDALVAALHELGLRCHTKN
jgi:CheY-like chemotaxis protein